MLVSARSALSEDLVSGRVPGRGLHHSSDVGTRGDFELVEDVAQMRLHGVSHRGVRGDGCKSGSYPDVKHHGTRNAGHVALFVLHHFAVERTSVTRVTEVLIP